MVKVDIKEAKTHLSRYIEQVELGEIVVVCRHNKPVAEFRAICSEPLQSRRIAGLLKGQVKWTPGAFDLVSAEELDEFDGAQVHPGERQH